MVMDFRVHLNQTRVHIPDSTSRLGLKPQWLPLNWMNENLHRRIPASLTLLAKLSNHFLTDQVVSSMSCPPIGLNRHVHAVHLNLNLSLIFQHCWIPLGLWVHVWLSIHQFEFDTPGLSLFTVNKTSLLISTTSPEKPFHTPNEWFSQPEQHCQLDAWIVLMLSSTLFMSIFLFINGTELDPIDTLHICSWNASLVKQTAHSLGHKPKYVLVQTHTHTHTTHQHKHSTHIP